jgi:hypothetical protein
MADRTADYINHMKAHFTGFQQDQPLMTVEDNTSVHFGVRTGNKLMARGSVKIGNMVFNQGTMQSIDLPVAPFVLWVADLTMVFQYQGNTHGERWLFPVPGGFVNNEWDNISPGGTLTLHLKFVPGQNGQMAVSATVEVGHDDRPNNFVKNIALGTARIAAQLTQGFTGQAVGVSNV